LSVIRSLSVLTLLALATGCAAERRTPTADPSPPAAVSPADTQPPGKLACALLAQAIDAASLMDPSVTDAIAAASRSGNPPVSAAGQRLAAAYAAAVGSRGTEAEPDAVAGVSAAGAAMADVCRDTGLEVVG
jgi:hypothetical protein